MSLERLVPGTDGWDKYHADHVQRYNYFASRYSGKSVLDMACGAGYGSAIIASNGASHVTGIDIAAEAVSFAKANYNSAALDFRQLDFREVSKTGKTFDLVVSFETIEHVDNPAEFIRVAASVLKPGGRCIISTPNKKKYSGAGVVNPFHLSELYFDDFQKLFSEHFRIEAQYQQSESIDYLRWLHVRQELDSLKYNYDRLPYGRLKSFVKSLVGKKDAAASIQPGIFRAREQDFILEPIIEYKDHYSIIILEGVKP